MKKAVVPILLGALSASPLFAEWQPTDQEMLSKWAKEVTVDNVWQEYPRPLMARENWTNLNGLWNYAVTPKGEGKPAEWNGEILVPFALESKLGGVGRNLEPDEALWYQRTFYYSGVNRTLLHFEAVDYETVVWLNGEEIGRNVGGNLPFSFDITPHLVDGENELALRVYDGTEGYRLHGKQSINPYRLWYTRSSGIWQTVWMEEVPYSYIEDLDFASDIVAGSFTVTPKVSGGAKSDEMEVRITASLKGEEIGIETGNGDITFLLAEAKLWTPEEPNLYDLKVELLNGEGEVVDSVNSYTAVRSVGKVRDALGNWRFTLNGEMVFHWGPLDQGWWPGGLLTPPSDDALVSDIIYAKEVGFNMIRKHIKVEPRRFYTHCDRLGILVWQDQVSGGIRGFPEEDAKVARWINLDENPVDGVWPEEAHDQFVKEYKQMVDHLRDFQSIVVWVPFNEAWGQHKTMEVGKMAVEYDSTRLINIASGGNFFPVGDIADAHAYPEPTFPLQDERFDDCIKLIGEFGGHALAKDGHQWDKNGDNWGYGSVPKDVDEWRQRYENSIKTLSQLKGRGIAGAVYTQTTDVEGEINGLLTYDRVEKIDASWIKEQSDLLYGAPNLVERSVLVATSQEEPQQWSYTFDEPAEGWEKVGFDASEWKTGPGGFGTEETPNATIGTQWDSENIWLRRTFELEQLPEEGKLYLSLYHDENVVVYLNGKEIFQREGFTNSYTDFDTSLRDHLKAGKNTFAISCKQTTGGQFIDVGIVSETVLDAAE